MDNNNPSSSYHNLRIQRALTQENKKKCEDVRIDVFVKELGFSRELRGIEYVIVFINVAVHASRKGY